MSRIQTKQSPEDWKKTAQLIRKQILKMTHASGTTGAHAGGSLSMAEIMAVLYFGILHYDLEEPKAPERDRFILSKGHGAMALYAALNQAGILSDQELDTFKSNATQLGGHPSMNRDKMIEFSSGSLGQGLSLAVGVCLGLKKAKNFEPHVYVLLGDGECDEGSIWEAAMAASHYGLDNLTVIVDQNQLQYDGETKAVMDLGNLKEKWSSFGWETAAVDGHCPQALYEALKQKQEKPFALIANTVKGKGVSFMERNPLWHNNRLSDQQYEQALAEVEAQL